MLTLPIYIPSKGRWTNIKEGTLKWVPFDVRDRVIFVVPEEECVKYMVALEYQPVNVISTNSKGIAQTRHFIGHHADVSKYDKFVMMDDDLKFFVRKEIQSTGLIPQTPEDFKLMMWGLKYNLRYYSAVGISARQGNNNSGIGDAGLLEENTRLLRVLAYRTADFISCEHGRVEIAEDHDVNLQLLEKGLPNANLMYWSQDQAQTQAAGGCSTYRTKELHEKSQRKLAELHPGLVKIVQKTNKTGGDFGTRIESVISWKKAFKQGEIK